MSRISAIKRRAPFIATAILTAHQVNLKKGFKQRDTRRYLDELIYLKKEGDKIVASLNRHLPETPSTCAEPPRYK